MVIIRGISKSFDGKVALHPFDLALASEQTHVLLGSSGSGKSTFLKVLLGILSADAGEVEIFGEKVTPESQRSIARKIGYVPQEGGLFPHMSARENVSFIARLEGWDRERIARRITELSELVGLPEAWLARAPSGLSGGQRQRVAIMRALFLDPKLLVMDEPLGALDPLIRARLQDDLREIFARLRKLVILVTHDLVEARLFGRTISLFHEGRLLQHGSFDDLRRKPADPFVAEFIAAHRQLDEVADD